MVDDEDFNAKVKKILENDTDAHREFLLGKIFLQSEKDIKKCENINIVKDRQKYFGLYQEDPTPFCKVTERVM